MVQTGKIWIFYDAKAKKQSKPLNATQAQALILNLAQKKSFHAYIWTPGWTEWIDLKSFLELEQEYFVVPPSIKKKSLDKTAITRTLTKIKEIEAPAFSLTKTDFDKTILIPIDEETIPQIEKSIKYTQASPELKNQKIDYGYFHPDFRIENIDPKINRIEGRLAEKGKPVPKTAVSSDRRDNVRYGFSIEVALITKKGKTFKSASENISLGGVKLKDPIPKEFITTDFTLLIENKLEKDPKKAKVHLNCKCVGDLSDPRQLVFSNPDPKILNKLETLINTYLSQVQKKQKTA